MALELDLQGKNALITGGSKGLGLSSAILTINGDMTYRRES